MQTGEHSTYCDRIGRRTDRLRDRERSLCYRLIGNFKSKKFGEKNDQAEKLVERSTSATLRNNLNERCLWKLSYSRPQCIYSVDDSRADQIKAGDCEHSLESRSVQAGPGPPVRHPEMFICEQAMASLNGC